MNTISEEYQSVSGNRKAQRKFRMLKSTKSNEKKWKKKVHCVSASNDTQACSIFRFPSHLCCVRYAYQTLYKSVSFYLFLFHVCLPKTKQNKQGKENLTTERIKLNKLAQQIRLCSLLIGRGSQSEQRWLREQREKKKKNSHPFIKDDEQITREREEKMKTVALQH